MLTSKLDQFAAHNDLTAPFVVLSFLCALLVVYIMQQSWHDASSQHDGPWLQWARRIAFMIVALALVWQVGYLDAKRWEPTPLQFFLVVGLTLMFFVRALILFQHRNDSVSRHPAVQRLARR